ncbi:methylmalonyl-CoA mutase family protein [Roseospirillum parvum]|uniref:Methylmalonyl-CoA mutase n=1 Tax=Roseospirillum parvum TaxID=83401 RepID=A0A1G8EQI5_9PROT|nr:methylmalonyl-CoA mutase family protein [Roseospirillum parvum]SDH72146.1 methylmalonyl-CoA mutase [Roseospirillum parvum]
MSGAEGNGSGDLVLAGEFPTPDLEQWRGLVDKALKGAPFDKKLLTRTAEGLTVQPLYTRADMPPAPAGLPGFAPFTRGRTAAAGALAGWEIRQTFAHPDPAHSNREILLELNRGVEGLALVLDPEGRRGIKVRRAADLDRVLAEVRLDLAPVSVEAGRHGFAAATLMLHKWAASGAAPDAIRGSLNVDPLGTLAAEGRLAAPLKDELARAAALAAHVAEAWPGVRALTVATDAHVDAGATDAQELAIALAGGVATLKALEAAGVGLETALSQLQFRLSVGADFFKGIAKLRAFRQLWCRLAEACGAEGAARGAVIHAVTAGPMMSRRDPWVNILRATVGAFAAGVGGADAITVRPFDATLGLPADLARRIARNTQLILKEESNLHRVIDPAGGAWALETLSAELAARAWETFRDLERRGGLPAVLADGSLADDLAQSWAARAAALARRKEPVTGVSEFPNLTEELPEPTPRPDPASLPDSPPPAGGEPDLAALAADPVGGAIAALKAGAALDAVSAALAGAADELASGPLPSHRLGEDFEALRDAADAHKAAHGAWPGIFSANLGPVAEHTARATFARNLFEAGGVQALPGSGATDPAELAKAFADSGAQAAVICGNDARYEELAVPVAQALKAAGCKVLYLAGKPGEAEADWRAAGIDGFIHLGGPVLEVLTDLHARLGVAAKGETR